MEHFGERSTMTVYGYIRTSRQQEPGQAGSDPETQRDQLRAGGVEPRRIYQDVGVSGATAATSRRAWHKLEAKLVGGDVVVVVALDRLGRRFGDMVVVVQSLHRRGVRLRSLAPAEAAWASYLDADPDSTEYFIGQILVQLMAYVASQERQAISRRTKAGLDRARSKGQRLGRPRRINAVLATMIRVRHENGDSIRGLAASLGLGLATVHRALRTP